MRRSGWAKAPEGRVCTVAGGQIFTDSHSGLVQAVWTARTQSSRYSRSAYKGITFVVRAGLHIAKAQARDDRAHSIGSVQRLLAKQLSIASRLEFGHCASQRMRTARPCAISPGFLTALCRLESSDRKGGVLIPNSEVARLDWKKPLTWLATLATLSPRERAVDDVCFQPSPEGRGWPAAGAFTSRSGPGEGSLLKKLNTSSVLWPVNAGNSDSMSWPRSAKLYFGIRD